MKKLLAILLTLTTLGCLGLSGCKKRQAIGKFYTLQEAFDQGFLTENDLKSIAYYNNGGRENNEDKIEEDFVPQPLNPKYKKVLNRTIFTITRNSIIKQRIQRLKLNIITGNITTLISLF